MSKTSLTALAKLNRSRYIHGAIYICVYLTTIILSAWLVNTVGVVPVGFGLYAPAAAYVVGVTMVFRDLTQDQLGPRFAYGAMLVGTLLSVIVSPLIAFAAGMAFLVSETLDQLVYTPVRKVSLVWAVLLSNAVGIIADSLIFTQLAFGSTEYAPGQIWAKIVSTIIVVLVLKLIYRKRTTVRPIYLQARDMKKRLDEKAEVAA